MSSLNRTRVTNKMRWGWRDEGGSSGGMMNKFHFPALQVGMSHGIKVSWCLPFRNEEEVRRGLNLGDVICREMMGGEERRHFWIQNSSSACRQILKGGHWDSGQGRSYVSLNASFPSFSTEGDGETSQNLINSQTFTKLIPIRSLSTSLISSRGRRGSNYERILKVRAGNSVLCKSELESK